MIVKLPAGWNNFLEFMEIIDAVTPPRSLFWQETGSSFKFVCFQEGIGLMVILTKREVLENWQVRLTRKSKEQKMEDFRKTFIFGRAGNQFMFEKIINPAGG